MRTATFRQKQSQPEQKSSHVIALDERAYIERLQS